MPEAVLKPTPQSLYPTHESLDSFVRLARESLPITDQNTLHSVLMTYHNTLLQELSQSEKPARQ